MKEINYKVLSLALFLAVIVLAVMLVAARRELAGKTNLIKKQTAAEAPQPKFTDLKEKIPDGFPAEFALPQGASNVQNSTADVPGVRTDLTEQFSTSLSIAQVAAYYQQIFKRSGWQANTLADDTKTKAFALAKGDLNGGLFLSTDPEGAVQVRLAVSILVSGDKTSQ